MLWLGLGVDVKVSFMASLDYYSTTIHELQHAKPCILYKRKEEGNLGFFHISNFIKQIRRQSTSELLIFKERWEKAVKADKEWVDPYKRNPKSRY